MGIDRIGGRPGTLPAPEAASPPRADGAVAPFDVGRTQAPGATPVDAAVPASPALEQLRSGQIDLARYLDLKVDEATSHLSALPASQLEAIRAALRDRIAADPSLVDLVHAATGQAPASRDD
jgi:hypothetical protein